MRTILLISMLVVTAFTFGQKKPFIEDYNKVVAAAKLELEQAVLAPEGTLYLFQQETGISGSYSFDITLHEKGKVATVFVTGNEGGTIKFQNQLKDFVKEMKFNFKMPKGKDYKFNYEFNFNK